MYYYANEMVMSRENARALKPSEIKILEHVRTYEFADEYEEEMLPAFVEIRCQEDGITVKKQRIVDFPEYETEKEATFQTIEEATDMFRQWIGEIE
ncbi:hypothetical protein [Brevibacillus migulae]|uniref:hypothetical protein n=1 Tax=Brevibacillus migulae TaxID=1644114 RepID=UPI00106E3CA4|nr:hypothetical protein [Brevibacillus migulae]